MLDTDGSATYEFDISWTLPPGHVPMGTGHVHTGSIGALLPPGADTVEGHIHALRRYATISFDPNIRPALMPEHTSTVARVERLVAQSDVVKASDEDLAWLYPGEARTSVAERWHALGPGLVVVTAGADGSSAVCANGWIVVSPISVAAVDTVGAGDSYMAALLDGLEQADLLGAANRDRLSRVSPETLRGVLERSARAAAITVTRAGANSPNRTELELALLKPVRSGSDG